MTTQEDPRQTAYATALAERRRSLTRDNMERFREAVESAQAQENNDGD